MLKSIRIHNPKTGLSKVIKTGKFTEAQLVQLINFYAEHPLFVIEITIQSHKNQNQKD